MSTLLEMLDQFREPKLSEEQSFARHIKKWFPTSIIIGVIVGAFMSLFLIFEYLVHVILFQFVHPIIAMAIGGLIVLLLVYLKFEKPDENGISYVIERKHKGENMPFNEVKEFLGAGITYGSGMPIGREGPALIMGSALAGKIANWMKIDKDDIHNALTIGSAAATGALFQAPFGSAIFATEVPYKEDSDEPMLMAAFLSSTIAAVTISFIIGFLNNQGLIDVNINLFYLGSAKLSINFVTSTFSFILGIIIGLVGFLVIKLYYLYRQRVIKLLGDYYKILTGLSLLIFILIIAFLIIPNLYLAQGLESFQEIRNFIGNASDKLIPILLFALIVQILTTIVIVGAGFPGGIFGPSLTIGAIIGIIFALSIGITDKETITAWAIVGMSAAHAATTKTPIASILLVLEISRLPNLIIPIIIANIASYLTSGPRSLYEGQIRSREAKIMKELAKYDQLSEFTVKDVMTKKKSLISCSINTELKECYNLMETKKIKTIPILENEKVVGIISYTDVTDALLAQKFQFVSEIMKKEVLTLTPEMTAEEAMYKLLDKDIERAPVVDNENNILGILSITDIMEGHRKMMKEKLNYI